MAYIYITMLMILRYTHLWNQANGSPSWVWFCQRSLPVKNEVFFPPWWEIGIEEKMHYMTSIVWLELIWNLMYWIWLDYDCNIMTWIVIGLNWTVSLKCLEMTFVVIWLYINKTELNLIYYKCWWSFNLFFYPSLRWWASQTQVLEKTCRNRNSLEKRWREPKPTDELTSKW